MFAPITFASSWIFHDTS
jgi:hypothetical protein